MIQRHTEFAFALHIWVALRHGNITKRDRLDRINLPCCASLTFAYEAESSFADSERLTLERCNGEEHVTPTLWSYCTTSRAKHGMKGGG